MTSPGIPLTHIAALCSLALLTGCVTTSAPGWVPKAFSSDTPYLAQLEPGKYSPGWNAQGVNTDVKLEQSNGLGLLSLPELETLLNAELKGIKEAIGFPELPGKVYILASPTMNAMTKADGNIYVPIGMLIDIGSTDEAVALLAHETAHTLLNHTDTDLLASIQKKGSAAWALANQLGAGSADAGLNRRVRNTLAFSLAADRLLHPTWNRQQELTADLLGVDILVALGRDPNAMIVLLNRLDRWEEINKSLKKETEKRNSILVAAATAKFAKEGWQAAMMQALTPVGLAIEDKVESMTQTHASTEERLTAVNDYLRQHYRRADRPAAETRQWRKVALSAAVKREAANVRQAHTAFNELAAGNLTRAEQSLKRIPVREGRRQNYHQMLSAMVAEERNKYTDVTGIAASARELAYPSYRLLVLEERARQALAPAPQLESVKALYTTFDTYGRPPTFYADLIQLAAQTGNLPFKYDLMVRCYAAYLGEKAACDDAPAEPDSQGGSGSGVMGGLVNLLGKF